MTPPQSLGFGASVRREKPSAPMQWPSRRMDGRCSGPACDRACRKPEKNLQGRHLARSQGRPHPRVRTVAVAAFAGPNTFGSVRPSAQAKTDAEASLYPHVIFSEAHSLRILDGAVNRMAPELFDRVRVRRTRWNHCGRTPVADLTRLRLPAPAARSGRDDVAPFQPAVQVDVSAALRAERIIALAARLPAHRAGPLALAWTRSPSRGFVVVRGHRAGLASQLRWTS